MASIQRTAYPRFRRVISSRELQDHYTPTPHEWRFAFKATRAPHQAFNLVVRLKVVQQLGYVPKPDQVPPAIIEHIRTSLQLDSTLTLNYAAERTLRGHAKAIRKYLQMQAYSEHGRHVATVAIYEAVQVMDRPLDLINVAIEALRKAAIELPAFSTLDKLVERIRALANGFIMRRVAKQVTPDLAARLDALLITPSPRRRSPFSRLKEMPKRPTHDHFEALQMRFAWLEELGDMTPVLASLAPSKIATFAEIATDLDAAALRTDLKAAKRWVVLACFVHRVQVQARDDLADMFVKYVGQKHKTAQKALDELRKRQQATVEELLATLSGVTEVARDTEDDATLGADIREVLAARGGIETILAECQVLGTYNGNTYLPLLPIAYRGARKVLFRLLDLLTFTPTTEDDGLLPALELLRRLRLTRSAVIPASVSVTFANEQWQRTVVVMYGKRRKKRMFDRRLFELCVFTALADGLRTGDIALQDSERYADYRTHLLSWDECQPLLADYCRELGLAGSAQGSVFQLWIWLKGVAEDVDRGYPDQSDLIISEEGVPTLKRLRRRPIPQELAAVEAVIGERMPDRDVLEILCAVAHWTDWPRHFGPRSGFDPKLANATERHILTTFCYGCNLGPAQTERHTRRRIDAQQLATLNRQHVTIQVLEAARRDIIS